MKWWVKVAAILSAILLTSANTLSGLGGLGHNEHDLLRSIKIPFIDPKTQYFDNGYDGFPTYGMRPGSDIKSPYRLILPEKLYPDFSIVVAAKPTSREGGFLFAVVNPLDTIVQLGLRLSPGNAASTMTITLMYTDVSLHFSSQILATFSVPSFARKWSRFALRIKGDNITLFFNCREHGTAVIQRKPKELVFDSASTLYIGQAGPIIKGEYDGSIQEIKIYDDPNTAEVHCATFWGEDGSGGFSFETSTTLDDTTSGDPIDETTGIESTSSRGDPGSFPPFPPPPPRMHEGLRGEKGEKGDRGPPGESIRGPPGPPGSAVGVMSGGGDYMPDPQYSRGPVGPPGPPGQCYCNASMLLAGSDLQLIPGPKGEPGLDGRAGSPGASGIPGPPGERGSPGPRGDKGERGDQGAHGPEGLMGHKGEPGRDGTPGIPGPPGPPGATGTSDGFNNFDPDWRPRGTIKDAFLGNTGFSSSLGRPGMPGQKGDPGHAGHPGPRGERGVPGNKGDRGDSGMRGAKGDRGHQGSPGVPGIKGEVGAPGIDGMPGLPGENGNRGHKGDKGDRGPVGPAGPPGNGMAMDGVLTSIPGPPGEKGEKGDSGVPGRDGRDGMPGFKGDAGPPGVVTFADGNGETTVVKGEKGDIGKRGKRGKAGPAGPPGPVGPPGIPGDFGLPGWSVKGDKGDAGNPGQKGEPGAPGPGLEEGYSSTRGPIFVPVPGPPGPPGPQGLPGISIKGERGEPGPGGISYGGSRSSEPVYGAAHTYRPGPTRSSIDLLKDKLANPLKDSGTNYNTADNSGAGKLVPGSITFQNLDDMIRMSSASPVGTLAFLVDQDSLLVRVKSGWQYVALGNLVTVTTPPPPPVLTTPAPEISLPLRLQKPESSSLLNTIDGPNLRIAALNEPSSGDMRGIRGADYDCYRQAKRASLRGTFRAFLASRTQDLDSIVRSSDRDLPVVNIKGDVLFSSWNEIFNGNGAEFKSKRIYSFNGKNVLDNYLWPFKAIWHGSDLLGERSIDTYCDAWHSDSTDKYGLASSLSGKLLEQTRISCDQRLIVLCIDATSISRSKRSIINQSKTDDNTFLNMTQYSQLIDDFN